MTHKENLFLRWINKLEQLHQALLILILNPLGALTRGMKRKDRNFFLFMSFLLIPIYFLMIYSGTVTKLNLRQQLSRHVVGLILLVPVLIFSIDRKQSYVLWKRKLSVPLILSGILMLIISFVHPIGSGYRVFSLMLIFLFPALSLIWNNRKDYDVLFDSMAYAICIVGMGYFLVCVIGITSGQIDCSEPRFKATLSHSGNLSQVYTSVFSSGLYLIIRHFRRARTVVFASSAVGIGVGMLLLGQGRSCILACIACFIASLIYFFRDVPKGTFATATKKVIISVAIVFIAITLSSRITSLAPSEKVPEEKIAVTEESQQAQDEDDEEEAEEETEEEIPMEEPTTEKAPDSAVQDVVKRFSSDGKDINKFSSGRIALWEKIVVHLNMWGNDVEKQNIYDITQDSWLIYAHNIFLEISYRCGIPVGLLFLVVEYTSGCIALRYLFTKMRRRNYLIFSIMMVIIYISQSLLDCASMPFILESGLYFYFAITPMMERYNENK